ncbi:hypothetical protein MTO96_044622, partial [Rhipicephalus appendiculatus]
MHTSDLRNVSIGSRSSTIGPPLPFSGDSLPRAKGNSYVTSSTPTQQELEHIVGALCQQSFVPAANAPEQTAARWNAAPPLYYVAFIASYRGPSFFTRHDAAPRSSRLDSKGRPADHGRTTE